MYTNALAGGSVAAKHSQPDFLAVIEDFLAGFSFMGQWAMVLQQGQGGGILWGRTSGKESGLFGQSVIGRHAEANGWARKAKQNRIDTGMRSGRIKWLYSTPLGVMECRGGPKMKSHLLRAVALVICDSIFGLRGGRPTPGLRPGATFYDPLSGSFGDAALANVGVVLTFCKVV